jgi:hypothetical protein
MLVVTEVLTQFVDWTKRSASFCKLLQVSITKTEKGIGGCNLWAVSAWKLVFLNETIASLLFLSLSSFY